ncbi:DUF924 family protein [Croceicoccus sp. YJ47]|uniref:DUF924 family protein n=1 Tax=Croceicoccus sp. YJ47 TaxID=2798724 RepID=UPI001924DBC0|nr:DUF924 family protein [Croceicoccus sp. YJ47]QQN73088.1 DUF924 domain-containing protein [Croceicoccus sp. YJ47]
MALAPRPWAADMLHVWFGVLSPRDWFGGGDDVDALLRRRFAREWARLRGQPARAFLHTPDIARAAILLFDQVPRNLFRDDPRAFANDPLARAITDGVLRRGWDRGLTTAERQFILMPLMHSEAIADQRRSLRLFARLGNREVLSFARVHYRMIARFGRFPHRNDVLGKQSSAAEERAIAAGNDW